MQYVLHSTKRCNYRCDYCPQEKADADMDLSTARAIVDLAYRAAMAQKERSASLSFYGGEPLLRKDWMMSIIHYATDRYAGRGFRFRYRMTTNGALLDEAFLRYAAPHRFRIALSIDGTKTAHDLHRRTIDGSPTHEDAVRAARLLLAFDPRATAMATVNPDTASMLAESVRFLYALGFRQIVTSLNHLADWTDADMEQLRGQYAELANWYGDRLLSGETLRLPLFDAKLVNHLHPELDQSKCVPGRHRLSFDVSGAIYPCTQYLSFPEYRLGDAATGVCARTLDTVRREAALPIASCSECALIGRCDNHCGCKNLETTGSIHTVSPVVCAHERLLIPIADALGNRILR